MYSKTLLLSLFQQFYYFISTKTLLLSVDASPYKSSVLLLNTQCIFFERQSDWIPYYSGGCNDLRPNKRGCLDRHKTVFVPTGVYTIGGVLDNINCAVLQSIPTLSDKQNKVIF